MKILVVTGSARPNSVNNSMVEEVKKSLASRESVEVSVADLSEINLPFMNAPMPPSQPAYEITDSAAKSWSEMVTAADGVVFVMPEYNHNLSAIQKNAFDWLWKEWQQKPAAVVAYGAYAGKHTLEALREMNTVLNLELGDTPATFTLGEAVGYDGTINDQEAVDNAITSTIDELLTKIQ